MSLANGNGVEPQIRPPASTESRSLLLYLAVSVLLLIPCFWQAHIEAGDLGSHVYNAWLAQLVEQGRAPGVYVVWQWDNVLFDLLLFYSAKLLSFTLAEKLSVSICVLVFFWGVFRFMKAVSGRWPWCLAPGVGMLTYSYIFHMGFMNYYVSLGLACLGLSFLWPARRNGLIVATLLLPFMVLAHPLGFLLFVGVATFRLLWPRLPGRSKGLLPVTALLILLGARWFVAHHHGYEVEWRQSPFWELNGADQFHVFGERYAWFSCAMGLFFVLATAMAAFAASPRMRFWKDRLFVVLLYLLSFCATAVLPENLHTDPTAGWIGALVTRLTLVSAIFGFSWLATLPPRSWHLAFSLVAAVFFFTFLYQDTAFLNRMEANTRLVTEQLPFGTRTLSTIFAPNDYRTIYLHIPDRACIGHCFLVSNYEPSARQFRVRVRPGSPVVTASQDDSEDMQSGTYDIEDEDLPLKQIYQCQASDLTKICIRDLQEDEKNGRLGYHPVSNPFFSQNP